MNTSINGAEVQRRVDVNQAGCGNISEPWSSCSRIKRTTIVANGSGLARCDISRKSARRPENLLRTGPAKVRMDPDESLLGQSPSSTSLWQEWRSAEHVASLLERELWNVVHARGCPHRGLLDALSLRRSSASALLAEYLLVQGNELARMRLLGQSPWLRTRFH